MHACGSLCKMSGRVCTQKERTWQQCSGVLFRSRNTGHFVWKPHFIVRCHVPCRAEHPRSGGTKAFIGVRSAFWLGYVTVDAFLLAPRNRRRIATVTGYFLRLRHRLWKEIIFETVHKSGTWLKSLIGPRMERNWRAPVVNEWLDGRRARTVCPFGRSVTRARVYDCLDN